MQLWTPNYYWDPYNKEWVEGITARIPPGYGKKEPPGSDLEFIKLYPRLFKDEALEVYKKR